jgi:hypothetical protein
MSVASPANGATVTALPTTIQVSFTNGADPTMMKALLDGSDITSQFSPADSKGVRQAQVDRPQVNLGGNQIQVFDGTLRASAAFTVLLGGAGSGQGGSLPLLVPIQTRYVTGDGSVATDYNIALYTDPNNPNTPTKLYAAQTPSDNSNTGFQILFLSRTDLSLVQNTTVPNQNVHGNWSSAPLYTTLAYTPPSGCGTGGCLVIVQSLGTIGYTPCATPDTTDEFEDCDGYGEVFMTMGGSTRWLYANGSNNQIAYSFIGNTCPGGAGACHVDAGTYFERLTCSGSDNNKNNPCDNLQYPTTSNTAPGNATPSQIGNMAGVLIRDNFNNYTYTQNAPAVSFSSGVDPVNVSHNFTINDTVYWSNFFGTGSGGFHVLVLDRTTLQKVAEASYPHDPNGSSELLQLYNFIGSYNTYGNLVFLAAFGNTTYTTNYTANRAQWAKVARDLIPQLGGTEQVFYLLNNPEHCSSQPPLCPMDDYTLVGGFGDTVARVLSTGLEGEVGAEMSSVIARETEVTPLDSTMQGFLEMDHEGYYSAKQFGHHSGLAGEIGMSNTVNAELLSASLRNPTPWPFPGPDPAKAQAAYTWISQQLCFCDDIRSAYINLDIDPSIWLSQLQQLTFSANQIPNSDHDDFIAMQQQLTTEFQYVTLVRLYQRNLLGLYQDEQANLSLLLQQDTNNVLENLQIQLTQPVPRQSWTTTLGLVFGVESTLVGYIPGASAVTGGVKTALTLGTLAMNRAAAHTNSAGGQALKAQENAEDQAAKLAGDAADEFAQTLISLGNEFDRIVSDWGRLKAVGGPLLNDQVPWDSNATGMLLEGYDRLVQRNLYTKLIMVNSQIDFFYLITDQSFIGDTEYANDECTWKEQNIDPYWQLASEPLLFYPSGKANTDGRQGNRCCNYPHDSNWGIWALIFNGNSQDTCTVSDPQPSTFGLFQPLDPNNPSALGMYRLWFFTRSGYKSYPPSSQPTPCYEVGCG